MSRVLYTENYIDIKEVTPEEIRPLYPYHVNRAHDTYTVSKYKLPEVIRLLRDEKAIYTMPSEIQQAYHAELNAREKLAKLFSEGPQEDPFVTSELVLSPHQQMGREIAKIRDKYGFFFDTRTGKTPLSLSIIKDSLDANPDGKWIVVCPLILMRNAWEEDLNKFEINYKYICCHHINAQKRRELIAQDADIYILNTESFVNYIQFFDGKNIVGCIVDESSDMKSGKSQISKALVKFSNKVKRFYLLSGTPAPNGEYEYYMQLKAIDPYGIQSSLTQFKQYFFVNTSYNPQFEKLKLLEDKRGEFNSIVSFYSTYVDKEDVLQTPGRVFYDVIFDMPEDVTKIYRKFKRELGIKLKDETIITAPTAAVCQNKLNQITSGFVIDTFKKEIKLINSYRFDLLMELLKKLKGQVIIWATYRYEFETIEKLLGDECRCIYGATSAADKTKNIKLFKDKKITYLVANPASADKGLTLTNCHINVYFSLTWSYETYKQSTDRIYGDIRIQPHKCEYYIMQAKGTIDELIYNEVLTGKQEASYVVLNYLKSEFIKGEDDFDS